MNKPNKNLNFSITSPAHRRNQNSGFLALSAKMRYTVVMKRVMIDQSRCIGCLPCKISEKCAYGAVFREDSDRPWIDFFKCRGCMKCVSSCPQNAIEEQFYSL